MVYAVVCSFPPPTPFVPYVLQGVTRVIQDFEVGGGKYKVAHAACPGRPPPRIFEIRYSEVNSGRFCGVAFSFCI